LAHTGADEAAILAAIGAALAGTGITLIGMKKRREAAA
jgi:LPXTG-motif cell wall-anchored protein